MSGRSGKRASTMSVPVSPRSTPPSDEGVQEFYRQLMEIDAAVEKLGGGQLTDGAFFSFLLLFTSQTNVVLMYLFLQMKSTYLFKLLGSLPKVRLIFIIMHPFSFSFLFFIHHSLLFSFFRCNARTCIFDKTEEEDQFGAAVSGAGAVRRHVGVLFCGRRGPRVAFEAAAREEGERGPPGATAEEALFGADGPVLFRRDGGAAGDADGRPASNRRGAACIIASFF